MIEPPKATKAPTIERKAILDWSTGTVTDYDARRVVDNSLVSTSNMVLEQNGVIRPRPALVQYGPQPIGKVLGEIFECKVMEGTTPKFYMVAMMVKDGVANVYYATGESASWTKVEGRDYAANAPAHFVQVRGKILVLNGEALSFVDTKTWQATAFQSIEDPEQAPSCAATGLSGSEFKVYYAITANSTVGETAGSPVAAQAISTQRDLWSSGQKVTITWGEVEGAKGYNVYMGVSADGAGQPELYLIASGLDPTIRSFTDDGKKAQILSHGSLPNFNSTSGPKARRGTVVNGRVWLVGDVENPYYVRRGGDYDHELDFSPGNGGGFTPIASGTKEVPIAVMPFRKGSGDSTVVVLTQGANGSGKRYHLVRTQLTYGDETIVAWEVVEDSGTDGTDSPDGVVIYNNSLYYPSRDGFKTTGTIPQLQNVLSTTQITATIKDQIALLNTKSMDKAVGLAYEGCLYWALPVSSDENSQVWVLDIEHDGAWILAWHLKIDWMWLYNDNFGETHFLILSNNKIFQMSRHFATQDDHVPFMTEARSGQIKWSKDGRDWARLIQVVFTLLRPYGKINLDVSGYTEDGEMTWRESITITSNSVPVGFSDLHRGWGKPHGFSKLVGVRHNANDNRNTVDAIVEVDEDVQWFEYRISSTASGVDYAVSSVVAEYVGIGIKDLS